MSCSFQWHFCGICVHRVKARVNALPGWGQWIKNIWYLQLNRSSCSSSIIIMVVITVICRASKWSSSRIQMPETEEEGRRKQRFPSGGDLCFSLSSDCFSLSSDYFWQEQNEEKACPGKKAVWLPNPVISQNVGRRSQSTWVLPWQNNACRNVKPSLSPDTAADPMRMWEPFIWEWRVW